MELLYAKVKKYSSSRAQSKDSGLTYGVDDEPSPVLEYTDSRSIVSQFDRVLPEIWSSGPEKNFE